VVWFEREGVGILCPGRAAAPRWRTIGLTRGARTTVRILVTGGAGYVGSHTVRVLSRAGHETWVVDDLSQGHPAAVPEGRLFVCDIRDLAAMRAVLAEKRIEAVVHCAGRTQVGESVAAPALYYDANVAGSMALLEAMRAEGVWRLVFSSTTAVYGAARRQPIVEACPRRPISPYGFTKLAAERMMADYVRAYGFGCAALRYFNAAGAAPEGDLGEDHRPETHLIPLVLQAALGRREQVAIFGDDYPTADGTCVRDYVHVMDLADAHLRALERLRPGKWLACNLGTGRGASVRQIVETCCRVTGRAIRAEVGPRRPGDAPLLVADSARAGRRLGWRPRHDSLEAIVASAWRWHLSHPDGFQDGTCTTAAPAAGKVRAA
jgi:UDP-glucose 4-epimerase